MCEWIRCEDRLPWEGTTILVWSPVHQEIETVMMFKHYDTILWIINGQFYEDSEVSHWMPLPEPPKEPSDWTRLELPKEPSDD